MSCLLVKTRSFRVWGTAVMLLVEPIMELNYPLRYVLAL